MHTDPQPSATSFKYREVPRGYRPCFNPLTLQLGTLISHLDEVESLLGEAIGCAPKHLHITPMPQYLDPGLKFAPALWEKIKTLESPDAEFDPLAGLAGNLFVKPKKIALPDALADLQRRTRTMRVAMKLLERHVIRMSALPEKAREKFPQELAVLVRQLPYAAVLALNSCRIMLNDVDQGAGTVYANECEDRLRDMEPLLREIYQTTERNAGEMLKEIEDYNSGRSTVARLFNLHNFARAAVLAFALTQKGGAPETWLALREEPPPQFRPLTSEDSSFKYYLLGGILALAISGLGTQRNLAMQAMRQHLHEENNAHARGDDFPEPGIR